MTHYLVVDVEAVEVGVATVVDVDAIEVVGLQVKRLSRLDRIASH